MGLLVRLERKFARPDDPLPDRVDAVVAIGIDVSLTGLHASPQSEAVAKISVKTFLDKGASKLILTGGYYWEDSDPQNTEAQLMYQDVVAKEPRIRKEDVLLESASYRTFMNADHVLPILQQHHCRQVVVVAQQWHARRVAATFKKRWAGSGIGFAVLKAWSDYGGGSQLRLENFFFFLFWDSLAFGVSKLRGYC